MKCPRCNGVKAKCKDSRLINEGNITKRRLVCRNCGLLFNTFEKVQILVRKKDNSIVPYDRMKVFEFILFFFDWRSIDSKTIISIVHRLEKKWIENPKPPTTKNIENTILAEMRNFFVTNG